MRMELLSIALSASLCTAVSAQTIDPYYADAYSFTDLGSPSNVTANLGGLCIRASDPNTLLIGGAANSLLAKLYAVPLTRDVDGHITSFAGAGVEIASLNGSSGGVDGGLQFGPGGVLFYTTYPDNMLGQIKPGSTGPDLLISLGSVGVSPSVGACAFVPAGFPGAGRLKLLSYSASSWFDTTVTPNLSGTYDVAMAAPGIFVGGGPEGLAYIAAGNPHFTLPSVLVCEYGTGRVVSYEVDSNGDPVLEAKRTFMSGLSGAEGALIDPVTGDFLFSTFGGGNRVLVIRGFAAPCPADLDGDSAVGASDLAILLGAWGQSGAADLDGDGVVGASDLAVLLGAWGTCGG